MVKIVYFIWIVSMFLFIEVSYASLIRVNDSVMYDDVTAKYWVSDFSLFENQNYVEQILLIEDLDSSLGWTSAGWGKWNMASYSDVWNMVYDNEQHGGLLDFFGLDVEESQFIHARTNDLMLDNGILASQDIDVSILYVDLSRDPFYFMGYVMNGPGGISLDEANPNLTTWVYADAVPVPEHSTILLFGLGIIGFCGERTLRKE